MTEINLEDAMGLWWKKVNESISFRGSVLFPGDPTAKSKSVPILWRFNQDWYPIQAIRSDSQLLLWEHGYNLYFSDSKTSMRYYKPITTRFVMVRIGPELVNFWARSLIRDDRTLVELKKVSGLMKPGNKNRPNYFENSGVTIQELKEAGGITWV